MNPFAAAPLCGLFLVPVGLCVIAGAVAPRFRMVLVGIGFALGVVAISLLGAHFITNVPPTGLQIGAVALAIVLEVAAFVVLMPRLRPLGARAALCGTMAIVGAHFLVMLPAFGPPIGVLGALCLGNALLAWRAPGYGVNAAWAVDGLFKLGVGGWMAAIAA